MQRRWSLGRAAGAPGSSRGRASCHSCCDVLSSRGSLPPSGRSWARAKRSRAPCGHCPAHWPGRTLTQGSGEGVFVIKSCGKARQSTPSALHYPQCTWCRSSRRRNCWRHWCCSSGSTGWRAGWRTPALQGQERVCKDGKAVDMHITVVWRPLRASKGGPAAPASLEARPASMAAAP